MSILRNLIIAGITMLVAASSSVFAQSHSSDRTYITRRGGVIDVDRTYDHGQITVDKDITGANGRTASAHKAIDANPSDGTLSRTRVVTGPNGLTRSESGTATFGDGYLSTSRSVTGRGGRTESRYATRSSSGVSVTRIGRGGRVYSRSRP